MFSEQLQRTAFIPYETHNYIGVKTLARALLTHFKISRQEAQDTNESFSGAQQVSTG
jgi:hypothetical protein